MLEHLWFFCGSPILALGLTYTPTAITNVSHADCLIYSIISYLLGNFPMMCVMLKGSGKFKGVKLWCPVFSSVCNHKYIIEIRVGIRA